MKRVVGILCVLLLAIILGLAADGLRASGVSMALMGVVPYVG